MLLNWKHDVTGYTARVQLVSIDFPDEPRTATCRVFDQGIQVDLRSHLGKPVLELGLSSLLANDYGVRFSDREQMLRFEEWLDMIANSNWLAEVKL